MAENKGKWSHVRDYLDAALGSEESFASLYNHPFFILVGPRSNDEGDCEDQFTTRLCEYDPQAAADFAEGRYVNPLAIVFPVLKRPGVNPYTGMISIGRADNCDIVIPSPGVSKFHCFIQIMSGMSKKYLVCDGGSRNGTRLNGTLITQREHLEIKSGDRLTLGARVTLCFFLMRDFQNILRKYQQA